MSSKCDAWFDTANVLEEWALVDHDEAAAALRRIAQRNPEALAETVLDGSVARAVLEERIAPILKSLDDQAEVDASRNAVLRVLSHAEGGFESGWSHSLLLEDGTPDEAALSAVYRYQKYLKTVLEELLK